MCERGQVRIGRSSRLNSAGGPEGSGRLLVKRFAGDVAEEQARGGGAHPSIIQHVACQE